MDSGTLALFLTGAVLIWLVFQVYHLYKFMESSEKIHELLNDRQNYLSDNLKNLESRLDATQALYDSQLRRQEQRVAGVEVLLVSTVGQETEDFCRAMDAIMERMDKSEEKQAPAQKLTLSEEHVGRFGKKKGKGRG